MHNNGQQVNASMHLASPLVADGFDTKTTARLARLLNPMPAFDAHLPGSPERAGVERYIAARFQAAHGATIHDFMPVLLSMGCHGRTSAATGLRAAAQRPLFLEQYLGQPVDTSLSVLTGTAVQRSGIAEIGNLVATEGGSSYLLFLVLTAVLEQAGFDWVVFTATPQVRKTIAQLSLSVHALCEADPARLTSSSLSEWGRYYSTRPQVVAGNVAEAMTVLRQKKLYAGVLSLFRQPIAELAGIASRASSSRGTYTFAA